MSQTVQGTFVTATIAAPGAISADLVIPSSVTSAKLTVTGLDASNTVKTQKRTSPSGAWVDQVTYNSNQTNTAITVATGEQWRLVLATVQTMKDIRYKLSVEN